jgi:hypothetical protein
VTETRSSRKTSGYARLRLAARAGALAFGRARARTAALALLVAHGCATCPDGTAATVPAAGGPSTLVGQLRLVPHAGTRRAPARESAEVGGARLVDYSTPGFAVVYLEGAPPAAVTFALAIADGPSGPHLAPANGALGAGGTIALTNQTDAPHVVSCPEVGIVARIPARQTLQIPVHEPGPLSLFLLDRSAPMAQLFAAPGPYTVVSGAGTWELRDVRPGPQRVRTWHPRFAATTRPVDVAPDQILQLQLEVGVERGDD